MSNAKLRFSSAILRLLGEELNPSPDQGIIELVKNAYDADAIRCTVSLNAVRQKGGSIRVIDDGEGLLPKQIREGWLVLGESMKRSETPTGSGRLLVGNKGLGRLAALRLGGVATLISRPKHRPKDEFVVVLDWDAYEQAGRIEKIRIPIKRRTRSPYSIHGTEILVERLRVAWTNLDVERLARGLMLLTDPFEDRHRFKPELVADEFAELQKLAEKSYLENCDYHLEAVIDAKGYASATIAGGDIPFKATHADLASKRGNAPFKLHSVSFHLWEFRIDPNRAAFGIKKIKKSDIQRWLKAFGGVSIYHRGVRVAPYGDESNDWLDMNLGRARSPEMRPSTNNSVGRVVAIDPHCQLKLKTDRLGFVDDEHFQELRQFSKNALDWMQEQRLAERKRRQAAEKKQVASRKEIAEQHVKEVLAEIPVRVRGPVQKAFTELKRVHQQEVALLIDENLLYHTLGTVGTTASAFAHQTKVPLKVINNSSNLLLDLLGKPAEPSFPQMSEEAVHRIGRAAAALLSFTSVTLKLLEHEKRRASHLALHTVIDNTVDMLKPFLDYRHTEVVKEYHPQSLHVRASLAAFEAILTNLISNSLQAFAQPEDEGTETLEEPKPLEPRKIVFRTTQMPESNLIKIVVLDNGPGIKGLTTEEIWRPGKTTTVRGTGLGLAIVRDVISEMNGTITALAQGELGGAQFTIELPQA